ncbi:hypothetical protein ACIZ62_08620 [Acetobacterium carbinolicum]|jgi:hypothetical protein|uniref:hypothetical protein n=1 Tax=Acetobacterium carbinolicum TaxID=52690 RepID=UPI002A3C44CD|nr:hypothetical protein [Acetobacterium sp.]
MKKLLSLIMVISMFFCLSACSPAASKEPANLTGEWKQVNSGSNDSWQAATIEGETITINWVSNGGDTKSLYWAGTYIAPTTTDEPYTWDSVNDHSQTDKALLASEDETKTMTYENDQLSYSASLMGTTTTVRLEKQK